METICRVLGLRWAVLVVAGLAPVAWGSSYYVTATFLPPDRPLFAAAVRALPFGLLLLAVRPRLPQGVWWGRVAVLGTVNVGVFFVLVFVAAYRLPGGLAATLTAIAPLVVAMLAWWLLGERPSGLTLAAAALGVVGVALLVLRAGFAVDGYGVAAALVAVVLFSVGTVLTKRWPPPVPLLTFTAWQLVVGGLVLVPVALAVEGAPPAVDAAALGGFLYIGLVGTVVAFAVWFRGIQRLPAVAVSLVGLLNPVSGTVIGVTLAGEVFGPTQVLGTVLVLLGIVAGQPAVQARLGGRGDPVGTVGAVGATRAAAPAPAAGVSGGVARCSP